MDYIANHYNKSGTHNYIFGVTRKGFVKAYAVTLDLNGMRLMFNEKPTTAHRQTVVKYRSTVAKVEYLESHAERVIEVCTEVELKSRCREKINKHGKTYTENCGECFEWLMAEMLGATQNEKSNLKFTEGGDLWIDGKSYQVKYEKGAITIEG